MLSRPSDNGHTPFGDIYMSYSPDMKYWGEHRCVMKVTPFPESAWQCTKIGAGSVPFLTDEGWLMFYHGVITTCNGFRYSMGAVILDKENPEKVLYRTRDYLLAPAVSYELQATFLMSCSHVQLCRTENGLPYIMVLQIRLSLWLSVIFRKLSSLQKSIHIFK